MSRSGYTDDCDGWELIMWRGAVSRAIKGKRGQAFLRELANALDSMPVKELIADKLEASGQVCAIGRVGQVRGTRMDDLDPEDSVTVASRFGVANALVKELTFINDDDFATPSSPADRWKVVRRWVAEQLAETKGGPHGG